MTLFIKVRNRLHIFFNRSDAWLRRLFSGLVMLVSLYTIQDNLGFSTLISSWWIIILLSVIGAFLPMSADALILSVYVILQMLALSSDIAGVTLLLFVLFLLFSRAYQAQYMIHMAGVTVGYELHIPYIAPLWSGLFGAMGDVTTIIAGSTISYYLKLVKDNTPAILEGRVDVSALEILKSMFASPMFYIYLAAMVSMFVIISLVRSTSTAHSWLLGTFLGVLAEFVIMLGGLMFLNNQGRIAELIISNLVVLAVGLLMCLLFQDLDYNRVEHVQFEDDDYYYYVKAVPKIKLADEEKRVKRITKVSRKRDKEIGETQE